MAQIKNVHELDDEELEDCVDGSTDVTLLREILGKPHVVDEQGFVDPDEFANIFAYAIEGFISEEPDTDEWQEAWNNNWDWGFDIADNINSYISDNFKDE